MNLTRLLVILGIPLVLAACSSTTDPAPTPSGKDTVTNTDPQPVMKNVPARKKTYDATHGGVQIVGVYFDQNANKDSFGLASPEEWLVLQSDKTVNTSGWWFDAGPSDGQDYSLPDSINGRLYIFTRMGDVPANVTTGGTIKRLGLNQWLWNNSEPDTATIYDATGKIIDRLSY